MADRTELIERLESRADIEEHGAAISADEPIAVLLRETIAALRADGAGDDNIVIEWWRELVSRLKAARSALSQPAQSAPTDDQFLTAYVSKDRHVVGIDHPTEADWRDVLAAHIVLRDRLNERIAEQEKCPFRPAQSASRDEVIEECARVLDGYGEYRRAIRLRTLKSGARRP